MAEVQHISTTGRKQVVDLTDRVEAAIRKTKMQEGSAPSSLPARPQR